MSRYFSFGVLLAVIVLLIIMFYKLMVGFFVPLFLAALLVVIFNPLHQWFLKKCKGRNQIAAGLTTSAICLLVFAPMALVFMLAASEGRMVVQRFSSGAIVSKLVELRTNLQLDIPAVDEFRELEEAFTKLDDSREPEVDPQGFLSQLHKIQTVAGKFRVAAGLPDLPTDVDEDQASALSNMLRSLRADTPEEAWVRFTDNLLHLDHAVTELKNEQEETLTKSNAPAPKDEPEVSPGTTDESSEKMDGVNENEPEQNLKPDTVIEVPEKKPVAEVYRETIRSLDIFKTVHTGGKTWSWLKLMANPTGTQLEEYSTKISTFMREKLLTIGGATTAALASIVFGIIIMVVALYFFLLDGPAMLAAIKHVSPLDEDHDQELIEEFSTVSRAVVLATLLSALAQGVLAGVGLWFCGFEQVFLLTILTTCLALVPFVGAAAVWAPACVWLYAIDGRVGAAITLAIYGTAVISMVDNLIKPWVLHGQSNLHPLLALLSVLGGVTALGPMGILIGPMIVAFLQTTLEILRKELSKLDIAQPKIATEAAGSTSPSGATPAEDAKNPDPKTAQQTKTTSGKFGFGKKKKRR